MRSLHVATGLAVCAIVASDAHAAVIDFTSAAFASAPTLLVGGVTVTGWDGATVATEPGSGLGLDAVGRPGAIERILSYEAESTMPAIEDRDGELALSVEGTINAFTIMPFMIITGPAPLTMPDFEMSFTPQTGLATSRWHETVHPFVPVTFDFAGGLPPYAIAGLGLLSDYGQYVYFHDYLAAHGHPPATIHFGYSILSLDYTPAHVPEPPTLRLAALAMLSVLALRRVPAQSRE